MWLDPDQKCDSLTDNVGVTVVNPNLVHTSPMSDHTHCTACNRAGSVSRLLRTSKEKAKSRSDNLSEVYHTVPKMNKIPFTSQGSIDIRPGCRMEWCGAHSKGMLVFISSFRRTSTAMVVLRGSSISLASWFSSKASSQDHVPRLSLRP